jgi:hypothetical protein
MRFDLPRGAAPTNGLLKVCAIPERRRHVDLDDDELVVHLGWAFHLGVPRASVVAALPDHGRIGGIGAHGWAGTWLVNTTSKGLVRLELDPPGRATVVGFPVTVRVLRVSLAEPEAFLASVRTGSQA